MLEHVAGGFRRPPRARPRTYGARRETEYKAAQNLNQLKYIIDILV